MERRRHPRIQPAETITVVVLGQGINALDGQVVDMSSRGIGVMIPEALPLGTPVKIEAHDELLLAEVCFCVPHEGSFRVGLAVKHRLTGLAQLHALNRALTAEGQPVNPNKADSPIMER